MHHAVDAVIIACATDKIRRRVEMHEVAKAQSKSEIIQFQIPVWDPETGEVLRMATFEMSQEDYRASNKEWDIFEKHRFFTERLIAAGVARKIAEQDAYNIEHAISAESFQKLKKALDDG